MDDLTKQLTEQDIVMEVTDKAKELVANRGFDPDFGARPLRRAIQRLIENPLSEEMLKGRFKEGQTVIVDAKDGEIVFQ